VIVQGPAKHIVTVKPIALGIVTGDGIAFAFPCIHEHAAQGFGLGALPVLSEIVELDSDLEGQLDIDAGGRSSRLGAVPPLPFGIGKCHANPRLLPYNGNGFLFPSTNRRFATAFYGLLGPSYRPPFGKWRQEAATFEELDHKRRIAPIKQLVAKNLSASQ
jgi:hypothetical protein